MNTMLKHTKCGGSLVLDFSNVYKLTSPSLILGPEGLSAGVGEIRRVDSKEVETKFHCLKCGEDFSTSDTDKVSCQCFACKSTKPSKNMYISELRLISCENCTEHLKGHTVTLNETARKTLQFFSPKEDVQFLPLDKVLKKPINI